MIAQGDAIDAGGQQFVVDFRRQARAAGGVLGVGHHQIEAFLGPQPADRLRADVAARFADNVADEEDGA